LLLPGCLRGGTLKQWKFPSSKGEQKKRMFTAESGKALRAMWDFNRKLKDV